MFQIDVKSRKPIYEQIVDYFKELIISGAMKKDEKAPSVRELAKEMTINPNTIQKAYRELEKIGFFYSVSGKGSFVAGPDPVEVSPSRVSEMKRNLKTSISELLYVGCPENEIFDIIEDGGLKIPGRRDNKDRPDEGRENR